MTYLRVECFICGIAWDYFDEKVYYAPNLTTQVDYQGCVCPSCGSIGFIWGGSSDGAKTEAEDVGRASLG